MWWTALLDILFRWLLAILLPALTLTSTGCAAQLCVRVACEVPGLLLVETPSPATSQPADSEGPQGPDPRPNP